MLSNFFSFDELNDFYSLIVQYARNVIAVGYIRSPKAYVESLFQQNLKMGKVNSFDLEKRFPCYQDLFEKFDVIFGKENVQYWNFNPSTFANNCVVEDFYHRLGIDCFSETIVRVNEGLSLEVISLLYAYSKYRQEIGLDYTEQPKFPLLFNFPDKYQSKEKLRFSSRLILPLLEKNYRQIEWMENRMGVSLAEDILKDDCHAVHSEVDLLKFAPKTTKWLAEKLGPNYIKQWHRDMSPQEIG